MADDLVYSIGTVTVSPGDTVVVGAGTLWAHSNNTRRFDTFSLNGLQVLITGAAVDDTHLPIEPWPGSAATGAAYKIFQDSRLRYVGTDAMKDVQKISASMVLEGWYIFVPADLTEPDQSRGDEGQYARQPTTKKEWLKTGGQWVYQGIFGNYSVADDNWDAGTIFARDVIVPHGGKIWRSLQPNNQGHLPESSPTWWEVFLSGGDAYDIVTFDTDRPASGELVLKVVMTKTVMFYSGLVDSKAKAEVGATATSVYSYRKNGSQFATLTFAAGGQAGPQTGTFASVADAVFVAGDVLTIIAPAARDATLSGVGATLSGYRN